MRFRRVNRIASEGVQKGRMKNCKLGRGGYEDVPSTGKSSNSSSSSRRAVLACAGFETAAGSAEVDFVGWSLAVGVLEDIVSKWKRGEDAG